MSATLPPIVKLAERLMLEVEQAVRAGVPYPLIAERFSLTRPRVSQIATSAGIYRCKPRKAPCSTKQTETTS